METRTVLKRYIKGHGSLYLWEEAPASRMVKLPQWVYMDLLVVRKGGHGGKEAHCGKAPLEHVVVYGWDCTVRVRSTQRSYRAHSLALGSCISCITHLQDISPDCVGMAAVGTVDGTIVVVCVTEDEGLSQVTCLNTKGRLHKGMAVSICARTGSNDLWVAFKDGVILVFDLLARLPSRAQGAASLQAPEHPPDSRWVVGGDITCICCCPRGSRVAIGDGQGRLRVCSVENQQSLVECRAYFGGFTCLSWSQDGDVIAAGGQDDSVIIWSLSQRSVIARCIGHKSWVTSIHLSQEHLPGDSESVRLNIVSTAQDGRVGLWEVDPTFLVRPRSRSASSARSVSGCAPPKCADTHHHHTAHVVEAPRWAEVPVVEPVCLPRLHVEPICSMRVTSCFIVTCCRQATVRVWAYSWVDPKEQPEAIGQSSEVP